VTISGPSNEAGIIQFLPGVYENMTPTVYHRQNSFSRHDMLKAAVPAKLKWHKDHPGEDKPTPAQVIGSAFHTRLLEPKVFDTRYVVSPFEDYRSKGAKEWRDEFLKKGMTAISGDDMEMIDMMVQSAREHSDYSKVFGLGGLRRELTVIAKDPGTGLLIRARYDIVPNANLLADIKSAMDASPEGFGKAVWNLDYGMQAAHYLHVWNLMHPDDQRNEFVFMAIEKEPPYLCAMYVTPHLLIDFCSKILRSRRYVIAECLKTNRWPGYDTVALKDNEFELPRYALNDIERMEAVA
jgi:hypothetical protein